MTDTALAPTKLIEVNPPIEFGNKFYDKLDLREPTAGQVDKALREPTALRQMILLTSHVADWPAGAVEKLPVTTMKEAGTYLFSFLSLDDLPPAG